MNGSPRFGPVVVPDFHPLLFMSVARLTQMRRTAGLRPLRMRVSPARHLARERLERP